MVTIIKKTITIIWLFSPNYLWLLSYHYNPCFQKKDWHKQFNLSLIANHWLVHFHFGLQNELKLKPSVKGLDIEIHKDILSVSLVNKKRHYMTLHAFALVLLSY